MNRLIKVMFLVLITGVLINCASTKKIVKPNLKSTPPEQFEIQITVKKNTIIKSQLMDAYVIDLIPDLRFSFKSLYMGHLVFVFRSGKFFDSQWIASVPEKAIDENHEINGVFVLEAKRFSRSISSEFSKWMTPPVLLRWQVTFKNKRVTEQSLMNPRVEWGEFQFEAKDTRQKIIKLSNSNFPGCIWKGRYSVEGKPVPDGKVIVDIRLINTDCYAKFNKS